MANPRSQNQTYCGTRLHLVWIWKGRSTTEPIFELRILQEKYREKGKDLHNGICGFGKGVRQCTKGLGLVVVEKERNTGAVCRHNTGHVSGYSDESDTTEYFDIEVGLHQGSALSPLLFIIVMDVLASDVGTHLPWGLLFADDLALCAESNVEVEEE